MAGHMFFFDATRRGVLAGTMAGGLALGLPGCSKTASVQAARWTRKEVNAPEAARDLETYKEAVTKMLALPLTDPRNWYRQGLVHLVDCPHGNWWFFDWHRPFVGYFEQMCRELTGVETFALPYWDWTANNTLPAPFWDGKSKPNVLDPTSSLYFSDADQFAKAIDPALTAFWNALTSQQTSSLKSRGIMTVDALKAQMKDNYSGGAFARGDEAKTGKLQNWAQPAVTIGVLQDGLAAEKFDVEVTPIFPANVFNTDITADHQAMSGSYAVIEGGPHNNVHASISGLMGSLVSPIDPIFWLHHANIDRIWTVWSALQKARGKVDTPSAKVATQFNDEAYNFFVDGKGVPVTAKNTAGDYMLMSVFDYDYAGGSQITDRSKAVREQAPVYLEAKIVNAGFGVDQAATASIALDENSRGSLAKMNPAARHGVAHVTFTPIPQGEYVYHLYLSGEGQIPDLAISSKDYVKSFVFFGPMHMAHQTKIALAMTDWLARNQDRLGNSLTAHFIATPNSGAKGSIEAGGQGSLQSVILQIF